MARWTSKEIVLNIDSTQEIMLFLEAIQKRIKIVDIFADYQPGKVNIRFEGSKDNLQEAIDITKRIHQITQNMLYPDNNGFFIYDIGHLSRTTGKTFPVKVLVKALTFDGFEATRKEKDIKKGGFGIFSIQERLKHQGGRLEIESDPDTGSRVTILSPMAARNTNQDIKQSEQE